MDRAQVKRAVQDWVTVGATIVIALALSQVNPDYHLFSTTDPAISFPHRPAKVPFPLFLILCIFLPVVVIAVLSYRLPLQPAQQSLSRIPTYLARCIHSLHTALLGLGVSIATSTMLVTGIKNMAGVPRPDFLVRCKVRPGSGILPRGVLADHSVCGEQDSRKINEGFRSFPSGYATIAFATLLYLSIYLTARFRLIPQCKPPAQTPIQPRYRRRSRNAPRPELHSDPDTTPFEDDDDDDEEDRGGRSVAVSNPRAGSPQKPPLPLIALILPYLPLGLAIFVAGTRYFDFRNHGFDVLAGAAIGSATAWWGFRLCCTELLY